MGRGCGLRTGLTHGISKDPKTDTALAVDRITNVSVLTALGVWWGREECSGES